MAPVPGPGEHAVQLVREHHQRIQRRFGLGPGRRPAGCGREQRRQPGIGECPRRLSDVPRQRRGRGERAEQLQRFPGDLDRSAGLSVPAGSRGPDRFVSQRPSRGHRRQRGAVGLDQPGLRQPVGPGVGGRAVERGAAALRYGRRRRRPHHQGRAARHGPDRIVRERNRPRRYQHRAHPGRGPDGQRDELPQRTELLAGAHEDRRTVPDQHLGVLGLFLCGRGNLVAGGGGFVEPRHEREPLRRGRQPGGRPEVPDRFRRHAAGGGQRHGGARAPDQPDGKRPGGRRLDPRHRAVDEPAGLPAHVQARRGWRARRNGSGENRHRRAPRGDRQVGHRPGSGRAAGRAGREFPRQLRLRIRRDQLDAVRSAGDDEPGL